MLSTADDYFRFADMLLNGGKNGDIRILEEETVRFLPDAVSIVKGRKASANGLDWTDIPMEI